MSGECDRDAGDEIRGREYRIAVINAKKLSAYHPYHIRLRVTPRTCFHVGYVRLIKARSLHSAMQNLFLR